MISRLGFVSGDENPGSVPHHQVVSDVEGDENGILAMLGDQEDQEDQAFQSVSVETNHNFSSIYSSESTKVLNSTIKDLAESARDTFKPSSFISSIDLPNSTKTVSAVKGKTSSSETLHNKYKDILRAKKEDSSDSSSSGSSSSSLSKVVAAISHIRSKNKQEPRNQDFDSDSYSYAARLERLKMMKPSFGRYAQQSCLNVGDYITDRVLNFECGRPDCFWMFAWTPGLEELNMMIQVSSLNLSLF